MTRRQLEKIVHHWPFRPSRLLLADGDEILVRKPKAHVSGDDVALVGWCGRPGGGAVERFGIIDVSHVLAAEHISDGRG